MGSRECELCGIEQPFPTLSALALTRWCLPCIQWLAKSERATAKDTFKSYAERYANYLQRIRDYNEEFKDHKDFTPLVAKPKSGKGGAAFIAPLLSIDDQIAMISHEQQIGTMITSCSTKSRVHLGNIEYSSVEYVICEGGKFVCWQAMMAHASSLSLDDLGIEQFAPTRGDLALGYATFAEVNYAFSISTGLGRAFELCKPFAALHCLYDFFKLRFGTFVFWVRHYHEEDMDFGDKADWISHYITWNATTRLLQCYPEVSFLSLLSCNITCIASLLS